MQDHRAGVAYLHQTKVQRVLRVVDGVDVEATVTLLATQLQRDLLRSLPRGLQRRR